MAQLSITAAQNTQYVLPVDTHLEDAFAEGVAVNGATILEKMQGYASFTSRQKQVARDTFRLLVAAVIKALGLPGLTTTVNYRKSDGITNGTLTFTNGILTGST